MPILIRNLNLNLDLTNTMLDCESTSSRLQKFWLGDRQNFANLDRPAGLKTEEADYNPNPLSLLSIWPGISRV